MAQETLFETPQDIRARLLARYQPPALPTDPIERSGYLLGKSLFGGGGREAAGLEMQSATQMQDFMRQVKAEGGDLTANPGEFMQSLARKLADAGRINEAMQVIEKAQTMGAQAAQTEYRMSQAEQRKMEVARDKTDAVVAHLQGVDDQAGLDRAFAAAKRDPFTKDLDMSQVPTIWNEETAGIIEELLRSAQTANQELNLRLREGREARQERALASREARAVRGEGRAIEAAARAARGEARTIAAERPGVPEAPRKLGKPPSGFRWTATGDLEAITGGPGVSAKRAGDVASSITAIREVEEVTKALFDDRGELDRTAVLAAQTGAPGTKGRAIGQKMRRSIEVILRARTGAAAPATEVDNYMTLYMPSALDSKEEARAKLRAARDFFTIGPEAIPPAKDAPPASLTPGVTIEWVD